MKKNYLNLFIALILGFTTVVWTGCGNKSDNSSDNTEVSDLEEDDELSESEIYDARIEEMSGKFIDDIYVCKNGNFKIRFPANPDITWDIVPTDVGDIDLYSYIYEIDDSEAYMVAFGDYPDEFIDKDNPYALLVSAREGAVEDMDPEVASETHMEVNGFPAIRTYVLGKTDNMYIIYEAVIANNRLYQIMMARNAEFSSAENIVSFLDSFEITLK